MRNSLCLCFFIGIFCVASIVTRFYAARKTKVNVPFIRKDVHYLNKEYENDTLSSMACNSTGLMTTVWGHNTVFKTKCPYPKRLSNQTYKPQRNFWSSNDVEYVNTPYNLKYVDPYESYSPSKLRQWGKNCKKKCSWQKCVPARVSRDKGIKRVLREWMKLVKLYNVMTVNTFGSLIASLHRDSILMKWDTDIDFFVWAHDTERLADCMIEYNSREKNQFRLVVHPDWRCKFREDDGENWGGRSYYNKNGTQVGKGGSKFGINFVAPNMRLFDIKTRSAVDIFAMYPGKDADNIKPVEGKNLSNSTKWVNFINAAYLYTSVPRDDIFPLRRCNLEGVDTFCPNKGNNVLKAVFFTDVSRPNHIFDDTTGCFKRYKQ